jgi:hypothetical protein
MHAMECSTSTLCNIFILSQLGKQFVYFRIHILRQASLQMYRWFNLIEPDTLSSSTIEQLGRKARVSSRDKSRIAVLAAKVQDVPEEPIAEQAVELIVLEPKPRRANYEPLIIQWEGQWGVNRAQFTHHEQQEKDVFPAGWVGSHWLALTQVQEN